MKFKFSLNNFIGFVSGLSRFSKKSIAIIFDCFLCFFCTWLAFVIRLEKFIIYNDFNSYPALVSIILVIPIFWRFGLYNTIFRYTGLSIIFNVFTAISIYSAIFFSIFGFITVSGVPRSVGVIQPILLFLTVVLSRLLIRSIFLNPNLQKDIKYKKNALIYGAGHAGIQLANALVNSFEYNVIGFLDDNTNLEKQIILGLPIYSTIALKKIIFDKKINIVFLALPTIGRKRRNEIINRFEGLNVVVKTLPSVSEIVDGKISISDIKDFEISDLLNRNEVTPDVDLLNKNIKSKIVCVTGAGGSIGFELSRQIIKLDPKKLILLEINEFALFKTYNELETIKSNTQIIPLLCNVQNQKKLENIFEVYNVDTVYHTAAYKHVPMVEENICEGLSNNLFSTLAIAHSSINKKVSTLVFVSSDKAVRPTNLMGASKRLCELCLQGLSNKFTNCETNISIVRFGNVLESSGSVIPKFREQIKAGGPVTLTHYDVTRYFMTVAEAAQLVIQAGAMGKDSEVFVLDMGESIKIRDLIFKMISLSGFTVKDKTNLFGDIEIMTIGLRPGEKLYEELLIGDNPEKTNHSKILKINEPFISYDVLEEKFNELKELLEGNNIIEVKNLISTLIPQFNPDQNIVDHLYIEKNLTNT